MYWEDLPKRRTLPDDIWRSERRDELDSATTWLRETAYICAITSQHFLREVLNGFKSLYKYKEVYFSFGKYFFKLRFVWHAALITALLNCYFTPPPKVQALPLPALPYYVKTIDALNTLPELKLDPQAGLQAVAVQNTSSTKISAPEPVKSVQIDYSDEANTYEPGQCVWYAKQRRPDLPNTLGNANTWFARAQALGLATGTSPKAGAIGTTTAGYLGHVVYVESVNGDGTINYSAMNELGVGVKNFRTAPAAEFLYIY